MRASEVGGIGVILVGSTHAYNTLGLLQSVALDLFNMPIVKYEGEIYNQPLNPFCTLAILNSFFDQFSHYGHDYCIFFIKRKERK
jgi:hypothetical protein